MQHRIVLAGWGQVTQPKQATEPLMDPLDMMVKASEIAAEQAGRNVLSAVDTLLVVRTQSRNLVDPLANLSTRLGFKPSYAKVSGIGGEVPQHYVNQAAGRLARGESETDGRGVVGRRRQDLPHAEPAPADPGLDDGALE